MNSLYEDQNFMISLRNNGGKLSFQEKNVTRNSLSNMDEELFSTAERINHESNIIICYKNSLRNILSTAIQSYTSRNISWNGLDSLHIRPNSQCSVTFSVYAQASY